MTSPIAKKLVITILDGLLMGAPTKAILGDIRNKWDVDIAALNDLIDEIDRQLNRMEGAGLDRGAMENELFSKLNESGPLGLRYQSILKRIKELERSDASDEKRRAELLEQRRQAVKKVEHTARLAGRDLADWSMDHANELASEIVRRV